MNTIYYYRCGRGGHWSKECPKTGWVQMFASCIYEWVLFLNCVQFHTHLSRLGPDRNGFRDRMFGREPYPPPPPPPFLRDRMMGRFGVRVSFVACGTFLLFSILVSIKNECCIGWMAFFCLKLVGSCKKAPKFYSRVKVSLPSEALHLENRLFDESDHQIALPLRKTYQKRNILY